MVLNMADFVKSWKSLQTLWKASKTVLKLFVSPCATFCLDSRCICKGWNMADFEQKAWGIAHGFEHGRFFQLLEIVRNSLKRLQNRSKMTASATVCVDFRWIRKCRKLADFEQRAWPIAHGFEHGRFFQLLEIVRNSLKRLQNRSKMTASATVCVDLGLIRKCRKLADFEQRAIAHGFEHGRFHEILEIPPNTLKGLQNRSKIICVFLRDFLCRFKVHL